MITSYEVAAVFKLTDEFSRPLARIMEQVAKLDAAIKGIGEQTKATNVSVAASLRSMGVSIGATTKEVDNLAAAWGRVSRAANRAAAAAERGGAGHLGAGPGGAHPTSVPSVAPVVARERSLARAAAGPGGLHYRNPGLSVPGAGHFSGGGWGAGVGFVAAGAAVYSAAEALEVDDIVSRGLSNVYPEGLPSDADAKKKELTQAIIDQARVTHLPLKTVAKMALDEIKTNANQPWENRMSMMPLVIQTAAREAYIKDVDPLETTKALVGQLHQIRAFTPDEVEKYGPMLAFFLAKDPNSAANVGRAGGYHTPIATSLMQIPIEQDLAAQTVLDRTGVGGKSGTWLREIATRAAKPVHDRFYAGKMKALQGLGLMDADEHATWMANGHFDEQKLLHILHDRLKGIPLEEKAGRIKQVFGERGAMGIALMTEDKMLQQYDELLAEARTVQSNADFWNQQNQTNNMQKLRGAAVDAQIAALGAGQVVAPLAVGAGRAAADALGWAAPYLPSPGSAGEKHLERAGTWGLGGAVLGGVLGIPGGPLGIAGGAALGATVFGGAGYAADVARAASSGVLDSIKSFFVTPAHAEGAPTTPFSDRFGVWPQSLPVAPDKQSYNAIPPPPKPQPITLTANMTMDSTTVARIVEEKIAQMHELPDSASTANGVAYPTINDWNPSGN